MIMLNMVDGCSVPDPSVLFEGYARTKSGFAANMDADKIKPLFESFIRLHKEPCFMILEVPTNAKDEPALCWGKGPLHKDVYYLDGLTPERAMEFLDVFGKWLIHDGLSSFGIGLHSGGNEIMRGKYNVVTVYTRDASKYCGFFESHGVTEVGELITAWDYFTANSPGDSFCYSHNGIDIYGLIDHLKQYGLYFAERREMD